MFASAYMHTSFLELHQHFAAADRETNDADDLSVRISLRRFDVDKAAGGPKLWSYSTSFEIYLDYEVEYSWKDRHHPLCSLGDVDLLSENSEKQDLNLDALGAVQIPWANWLMRSTWQYVESAARKIINDRVEPMLNKSLPSALKPVRVKEFSLGKSHPILGPLTGMKKTHGGAEIQLEVGVAYNGDVHVLLDIGGMAEVGVSNVMVTGTIVIKLAPFIEQLPIVGGVQAAFLDVPTIDLEFVGDASLANSTLIKTQILSAIVGALRQEVVLPNMVAVTLQKALLDRGHPMVSFKETFPLALIRIRIIRASRLRGADWSIFTGRRTSDPYCTIRFGTEKHKTSVRHKTTDPVWEESFEFLLHDWRQHISLSIKDSDFAKTDDLLGSIKALPCLQLLAAGSQGLCLNLEDTETDQAPVGPIGSQISLAAKAFMLQNDFSMFNKLREQMAACADDLQMDDSSVQPGAQPECAKLAVTRFEELKLCAMGDSVGDALTDDSVAIISFLFPAIQIPHDLASNVSEASIQVSIGTSSAKQQVHAKDTRTGLRHVPARDPGHHRSARHVRPHIQRDRGGGEERRGHGAALGG
jgi:hypothetical protein